MHIRIDSELKKKLDGLREGKTAKGKYGYKRKVHYNDLIKDWIGKERSFLEMQSKYSMIKNLVDYNYGIDSVLNDFVKVLEFYLRTHSPDSHHYDVYKNLFQILQQYQSRLEYKH
jgi:hypothetical protein